MANTRSTYGTAWAGWIVFAASMLLMIGVFNVIEGIVALVDARRLVVTQDKLIAVNLNGWGWTILIFGVLMVATGVGLFTARTWARVTAIVIVGLHFIAEVGWLGAYPVWSLLMIALDTTVLFALTARWSAVTDELDPYGSREDQLGQHASVG
ncbi:MAG: hypothetical protein AUI14_19665 [Actinobacteria bacterium 13_2_20CM_2_71_6]|nr:MAG: hypothetical protein AUI14_19665 [Actinobacteria bacterium 13_2_20CM_2_71_6]